MKNLEYPNEERIVDEDTTDEEPKLGYPLSRRTSREYRGVLKYLS